MHRIGIPVATKRKTEFVEEIKRTHKLRRCMTCDRNFLSEGIHNRMCKRCRVENPTSGRDWCDIRMSDSDLGENIW